MKITKDKKNTWNVPDVYLLGQLLYHNDKKFVESFDRAKEQIERLNLHRCPEFNTKNIGKMYELGDNLLATMTNFLFDYMGYKSRVDNNMRIVDNKTILSDIIAINRKTLNYQSSLKNRMNFKKRSSYLKKVIRQNIRRLKKDGQLVI